MAIADPSQNYIDANWGDPELEWTAELEAELPEELQLVRPLAQSEGHDA